MVNRSVEAMRRVFFLLAVLLAYFMFSVAIAQGMGGGMMDGDCPMCNMGWFGGLVMLALVLAVIAVLVAIAVYLFRRSRRA